MTFPITFTTSYDYTKTNSAEVMGKYGVWVKRITGINTAGQGGYALDGDFLHSHGISAGKSTTAANFDTILTKVSPPDLKSVYLVCFYERETLFGGGTKNTPIVVYLLIPDDINNPFQIGVKNRMDSVVPDMFVSIDIPRDFSIIAVYRRASRETTLSQHAVAQKYDAVFAWSPIANQNPLSTAASDILSFIQQGLLQGSVRSSQIITSTAYKAGRSPQVVQDDDDKLDDISAKRHAKDTDGADMTYKVGSTQWSEEGDAPFDLKELKRLVKKISRGRYKVLTDVGGLVFLGHRQSMEHQPVLIDTFSEYDLSILTEEELREYSQALQYQEKKLRALATVMQMARVVVDKSDASELRKKPQD